MKIDLLDYLAERLGVFISDLRLGFTQPALFVLLEIENRRFPVEEWNRALTYLTGRPCAFSYVIEAKKFAQSLIRRW